MSGPATSPSRNSRARFLDELLSARPVKLAQWPGFKIGERGRINPYVECANTAGALPRDRQLANVLVGDVVACALLHPGLVVSETREDFR